MAITDPKDTLSYHSSRVLCAQRDMSDVPCHKVALAVSLYTDTHGNSDVGHCRPEEQALWFYGMNHAVSLIASRFAPLEPLPEWELGVVETYHREMAPRAVRAFYYLLLVCIREARHNQSIKQDGPEMAEKFGNPVWDFFASIKGGESTIHQKFLTKPPQAPIGKLTEALVWQFYNSQWNGGYGGPAWGSIADCLHRFVTGEFSAEMMLDTIWTLAHNNGPVFNKGILYAMYTGTIYRVLDVQRGGQIPQAILSDAQIQQFTPYDLAKVMKQVQERFPEEIGEYVDWYVVEALGAVHQYHEDKTKQLIQHGPSHAATEAEKQQAAKKKAEIELAAKKAAEHAKNHFTVMPGIELAKFWPRAEAA